MKRPLRTLEARWERTDDFVEVDLVATLDEAKTRAIEFQLDHNVRAMIDWTVAEEIHWGRNRYVTFRLRYAA
jgi:hypothetical protein